MTKNRTADVDIVDILGVTETNVLILRLVSFGDHNIHKMPSSSSFSVALSLGLLVRGRRGLAQTLLYALEKGPKEENDNNKNAQPWEIYRWAQRSRNMLKKAWYSFNIYAFLNRRVKMSGYWPRSFLCFCLRVWVYFFNEPRRTRGQ